jgi:hypothetical protein
VSFREYMKRAELVLSVVIAVCAMSWAAQASHSPQSAPTQANLDESDIDRLEKELADPDVKVRCDALTDIGWNWNKAEIFQVRFGAEVSQRVEELRKSDDDEEKRLANWAAEGLEKIAKIWLERDSAKTR